MQKILNLILRFLGFIIREISSLIIKLSVLGVVIAIFVLGYMAKEETSKKEGSVIKINFANRWGEKTGGISSILKEEKGDFYSLIKKLDAIKQDEKIKKVLLEMDGINLDNAQKEEVLEKLKEIKLANKEIISYATKYTNSNYFLAANSNKIIMPPTMTAGSFITGYYNSLAYMGGLAQKLGVDVHVIHVGDYKAFGENYAKKHMSSEFRQNITELKDANYNDFVKKVSLARHLDKDLLNKEILAGKYVSATPFELKKLGLIDEVSYLDDVKTNLGEDEIIDINDYDYDKITAEDKIAIIVADGDINMDSSKKSSGITPNTIIPKIKKAMEDDNIKGIVLRVNSPGGSALASNLIYHKLMSAKKTKPIYISIGGVAASGGYYISCAGDKIFADRLSTTGSIGVVSILPNFKKIIGKTGVNMETLKKGEYSDLYSVTKTFKEKDKEKIYASSLKIYDEFIRIVASSRNKDKNYIDSIGQGRVYNGQKGLEIGLVDEIGGLEATIKDLAHKLKLEKYEVVILQGDKDMKGMILDFMPFAKTFTKLESIMPNNELFMQPIYYFPYNVN